MPLSLSRKKEIMPDLDALKVRINELVLRDWDLSTIKTRFNKLVNEGLPSKKLDPKEIIKHKDEILDRVQLRGEEYCYLTRNCAKGSATALFEEFGLGNMEIIRGLNPFPGIAMSGGVCGPVSGGLMALSLYFSGPDLTDFQDTRTYVFARKFLRRFEETLGGLLCSDIQALLLGKYYDPLSGGENFQAFNKAQAREKCPLAPGLGARIAAEIIIESMEKEQSTLVD
jgi:C_GCAxxG_C_C family probable redox protein